MPSNQARAEIRAAIDSDAAALAAIYGHHVRHGTGTFELYAPDEADMLRRVRLVRDRGLPWLVALRDGVVVGYAYANWFREREAFRWTVEDSVYIADAARGTGLGTQLLEALIEACTAHGARQMLAVIGDSANRGSIALHERLGFSHCGKMQAVGWKFERWLDVVLMERPLGPGADVPPGPLVMLA